MSDVRIDQRNTAYARNGSNAAGLGRNVSKWRSKSSRSLIAKCPETQVWLMKPRARSASDQYLIEMIGSGPQTRRGS